LLNKILDDIKQAVFKKLLIITNDSFNGKNEIIENISINTKNITDNTMTFYLDIPFDEFDEKDDNITSHKIIMSLINKFIDSLYETLEEYNNAYYFPASRTGFVLAHEEIYAGTFRDKFRGHHER
jgi:hypothetical protein